MLKQFNTFDNYDCNWIRDTFSTLGFKKKTKYIKNATFSMFYALFVKFYVLVYMSARWNDGYR